MPIAFSPTAAARARFRNHPEEEEMIVLEVHSVEETVIVFGSFLLNIGGDGDPDEWQGGLEGCFHFWV